MDKFELLSDLADGLLDSNQEQELFAELATNEELRGEFKQLLSVNSTIKSNRALFAVNSNSTNAIFSAIGIPAVATTSAISGTTAVANAGFNLAKYSQAIMGAGIATLTTAAIFILFFNYFGEEFFAKSSNLNLATTKIMDNNVNANIQSGVPIISSDEKDESKQKIKFIYIEKKNEESEQLNNVVVDFELANIKQEIFDKPIFANINTNEFKNLKQTNLPAFDLQKVNINENNSIDKLNLALEIRGFQNWHFDTETISPSKIANFNNTGVSAIINVMKSLSLGFEIRQETFFQKFNGLDMLGQYSVYEQQPNFTTYGMMVRYGFDISEFFKPIAQVSIGGTNIGFIGRMMGGLEYNFSNDLKFVVGIEYCNLFYNFQGSTFNSDKIGVNYGINYSF